MFIKAGNMKEGCLQLPSPAARITIDWQNPWPLLFYNGMTHLRAKDMEKDTHD